MKFYYLKHEKTGKFLNQSKVQFLGLYYRDIKKQLTLLTGTPTLYQSKKTVEGHNRFFSVKLKICEVEL